MDSVREVTGHSVKLTSLNNEGTKTSVFQRNVEEFKVTRVLSPQVTGVERIDVDRVFFRFWDYGSGVILELFLIKFLLLGIHHTTVLQKKRWIS